MKFRKSCTGVSVPPLLLVWTIGSLILPGCDRPVEAQREAPLVGVGVVEARRRDVPELANPNGVTRALNQVSIRARVRGVLEAIHFKEGDDVQPGKPPDDTPLFEIEKAPFQAKLDAARARLLEAQVALEQAQKSKMREIAQAQVDVDRAVLNFNRVEETRQRALLARGAASREDVDRAIANTERSTAQVEADRASLEQARVDFDVNIKAAEAKVAEAQAEVDQAAIDLAYCTIYAPIHGRIGEAKVKVGNLVGPLSSTTSVDYTELATIQQLNPMGVDIQCPSRYLERATRLIKQGFEISLERPGAETDTPRVYHGRALFIDNTIDPETSTVLIRAQVDNPDASLLPGEYVKLNMVIGTLKDAVVVPERAVQERQEGPTVLVVNADDVVELVPIESAQTYLAPSDSTEDFPERFRVVTAGLTPGSRVIVEGLQLVRPGQKVKPELLTGSKTSSQSE